MSADLLSDVKPTNNGTHLSVVGKDMTEIPNDLHSRFGSGIEEIDFSFNQIS